MLAMAAGGTYIVVWTRQLTPFDVSSKVSDAVKCIYSLCVAHHQLIRSKVVPADRPRMVGHYRDAWSDH